MAKVYLGLGTNLGDKEANLNDAIAEIEDLVGEVTALSSFYESEPWGYNSSNTYLNAAAEVETDLSPLELLRTTQQIERSMGRQEKSEDSVYEDRIIDIDILFYEHQIIHTQHLQVPHPLIAEREFVLTPLREIAPDFWHPVLKKKISEI